MNLPEPFYDSILFSVESGIVLGSFGIVFASDVVHSASFSSFVFARISLLYLLLNADFSAAAQILIYVGAVNIPIVFAVMLVSTGKSSNPFSSWTTGDGITFTLCASLFCLLINTISDTVWSRVNLINRSAQSRGEALTDNIRRIGSELMNEFLFPFELMSIILLVALVGAITVARREKITEL
uniref:NAD(P)H-quinone oxidoreductase subunit 6, chloroplastic n=1 Tax=Haplomitrium blumei TaxID=258993 RepID=A0A4Y5P7Z3_9MARC|nr:NADH-plastoquinone oxidoreductase subunit 6 [Haplomitrium blumei]QCW59381.1 NADH-plastoquinone oxidoreductase subunit 6 [Haplomitrium blumei]